MFSINSFFDNSIDSKKMINDKLNHDIIIVINTNKSYICVLLNDDKGGEYD